ncbi:adaptor-related protein complex 3, beta 2 subunit, isoform CRA_a [Mus musculus]|nr:adaptor-related protein complex 3, beta 2 subunit, isoform CRA_a [Mus musculus]EDL06944.1 adaptor-related protein complex 3, beta 2 subunit, isoform CRA_a [Mus musculus]
MSAAPAYSEDKGGSAGPGEPEYGHDPASGGIFSSDYKRHDDLKEMLDTNKDSLKLEAMKRIVAMIARGKNASDLFPAVVKNVACKNIELVYVYLVRYAEEQQEPRSTVHLYFPTWPKGSQPADPCQCAPGSL